GKGGSVNQIHEGKRGGISGVIDIQLKYLMETRWVKPIPISVERGKVDGHAVDIVRTIVKEFPNGDEKVAFALDRQSHLPVKVIYHTVVFGKEYTGGVSLSDYAPVNAIQMPAKTYGTRTTFQLNVEYNPTIFEQAPNPQLGIEAWKK